MVRKSVGVAVGMLLIVVAIFVFAVQHYGVYNFYGDVGNKWYFYGLVGVLGLLGIVVAVVGYVRGEG